MAALYYNKSVLAFCRCVQHLEIVQIDPIFYDADRFRITAQNDFGLSVCLSLALAQRYYYTFNPLMTAVNEMFVKLCGLYTFIYVYIYSHMVRNSSRKFSCRKTLTKFLVFSFFIPYATCDTRMCKVCSYVCTIQKDLRYSHPF